mgnify:FL=1|jgi:hypothetical protein
MAYFVLLCTDKPHHAEMRMAVRPDHLTYLMDFSESVKAAGPFLDDQGGMVGSMLIINVDDRAQAEQFAAGDPYAKAGLFSRVEIRPWKWVIGEPGAA